MRKNIFKAYTLVELIIVVMFIGIMAAIAIPRIDFAIVRKTKSATAVQRIIADLRRARTLAISDAAVNTDGFALVMIGADPGPYTGYTITNENTEADLDTYTFDTAITVTNGKQFAFRPLGDLTGGSDTQIDIDADGRSYTITIVSATGMVSWVQN